MYDRDQELREAIAAGERAQAALAEAAQKLDSAKGWGLFDIFAGGLVSSLVKHGRLDEARAALTRAGAAIQEFSREASDVRDLADVHIGLTQWDALFDIAFDNVISDVIVQGKMNDAAEQVDEARARVDAALARLRFEL